MSTDKSTVKAEVVACSRGLYDVTFVPHEPVPHFVNISFNEEDVPGRYRLHFFFTEELDMFKNKL